MDAAQWYDVQSWGVEGKGWEQTLAYYDRLPARAESLVTPAVWRLSRMSAGLCTYFKTNSRTIRARWRLGQQELAMPHMPATGVSGLDLYARDARGAWRWVGVGRPERSPDAEATLAQGFDGQERTYLLYLPLYNTVQSLEIGVEAGASFAGLAPRRARPLVYYGTSIVQGACASRPGMAHTAILGRRLDVPVINLGFSGNGDMAMGVAQLMSELDAALFVIDCLPNMTGPQVTERLEPFVKTLRSRTDAPIVLVEDRTYTNAPFIAAHRERHAASRAALRAGYERLLAQGYTDLHYVEGDLLLGDDGEACVDASHPTDLGFMRLADALEPVLRPLLSRGADRAGA
mgnify:CR=1 FL=1